MQALALRARLVSDKVAIAAGLDVRLLAMLMVMAVVWLCLNVLTAGNFLTPRNLFNLSLQVAVVGIMSCGMVLVIVSRHIDLSVGSQIGFIGVFGALLQNSILPIDNWATCWIAVLDDAGRRVADRSCSGPAHRLRRRSLVRDYAGRPAFFPQRRFLHQQRRNHRSAQQNLSASGRRPGRDDRRVLELGRLRGRDRRRHRRSSCAAPDAGPRMGWPPVRPRCRSS